MPCFRRFYQRLACIALASVAPTVVFSSNWGPTVLVRTEAFQVIDDADSSSNLVLRFGDTLQKEIRWDRAESVFKFSDGIEVIGTASGSQIHATQQLRSSGSLAVAGAVTFKALPNCTALETINGTVTCGTDDTSAGGGGLSQTAADARYVTQGGDAMTGGLLLKNGNPAAVIDPGLLLEIAGNSSGRLIHAQNRLESSGSLVVRSNSVLQGSLDMYNQAAIPSASSTGSRLFSAYHGVSQPFVRLPGQRKMSMIDPLLGSQWACVVPGTGATPVSLGIPVTITGTASHQAQTSINLSTSMRRTRFVTAAGAGNSAGTRANLTMVWRGNAAGLGGFLFYARYFQSTALAQQRHFVGLANSTAVIGNVNPSTLLNTVYIGSDSTQTTLRLCSNDNAGAATCTDLGAGFPANSVSAVFDVWLYAPPNGSFINYTVERLDSPQIATGKLTSDLPQNSVFLAPQVWVNNGTTAAAAQIELAQNCILSDY